MLRPVDVVDSLVGLSSDSLVFWVSSLDCFSVLASLEDLEEAEMEMITEDILMEPSLVMSLILITQSSSKLQLSTQLQVKTQLTEQTEQMVRTTPLETMVPQTTLEETVEMEELSLFPPTITQTMETTATPPTLPTYSPQP